MDEYIIQTGQTDSDQPTDMDDGGDGGGGDGGGGDGGGDCDIKNMIIDVTETNTIGNNMSVNKNTSIIAPLDDTIEARIAGLINELTTIKATINNTLTYAKSIEKQYLKEKKKKKADPKDVKVTRGRTKEPSGFAKPMSISDELCLFMKCSKGEKVARTAVTRYINKYIEEHKLQDSVKKTVIRADDKLKALLHLKDDDELNYFNLQKFMNLHFN